jgi:nicotinate-nucleotide adenylyltransferase
MCVLATIGEPRFLVSRFELEGKEVSYSVDTARHFQAANPGFRFWWAVGADNLPKLHTWAKLECLFQCARFLVVPRPPLVGDALLHAVGDVKPWIRRWLDVLPMEPVEAASTDVRERLRAGQAWEDSVPQLVARYITRYGLYQAAPVWQT